MLMYGGFVKYVQYIEIQRCVFVNLKCIVCLVSDGLWLFCSILGGTRVVVGGEG